MNSRDFQKRGPRPIGDTIQEIIARKGIARSRSTEQRQAAWQKAVGEEIAKVTRCGEIRRKKLEILVASSIVMQELTFQKKEILTRLNEFMPELQIDDLRFQVGTLTAIG